MWRAIMEALGLSKPAIEGGLGCLFCKQKAAVIIETTRSTVVRGASRAPDLLRRIRCKNCKAEYVVNYKNEIVSGR